MNTHGFKIPDYDLSEFSDKPLEHPIGIHLKDPNENPVVIGGETGTNVNMKIEKEGIRFTRTDNDYGEFVSEKFVPWSELLPGYGTTTIA